MKIAIISDVHGNIDALDAVLDDLTPLSPDRVVNLGDHASGPLDAAGAIDRLMALDALTIRGNHDRVLAEGGRDEMGASDAHAFDAIARHHHEWLRSLRPTARFEDVFACHGTPQSDTTYWLEEVLDDGSVRPRLLANVERMAEGTDASLILCGHTHIARIVRLSDGRLIVNPGSVGLPAYDDGRPVAHVMASGTPHAVYAIAERRTAGWSIVLRYVPYATDRMARMARDGNRIEWASAISTGTLLR